MNATQQNFNAGNMALPGVKAGHPQLNSTISDFKNVGMNSTQSSFAPRPTTNKLGPIKAGMPFVSPKLNVD